MRSKRIILALSFSIAVIRAAPILQTLGDDPTQYQWPSDDLAFDALALRPPSSFLVEFDLPPAGINRHERIKLEEEEFQATSASRHAIVAAQHNDFQSFLKDELEVDYAVRHEFFDLMNGISIDLEGLSDSRLTHVLEKIKSTPGVVKVSALTSMSQPKTIVHDTGFDAMASEPQLSTAHEQTGVLSARNKLNLTGKGIKVGIIDTGVDYTHDALGSCYGPGCKVQFGYDFVEPSRSEPGGFDCVGHGTHVAGIIAGNSTLYNFFGVAPQATLGAYRVFPCNGSAKDDVIIAALERAYADGMDIVNLSLGGGSSWAGTPLSKAAGSLARLGVVVVAAIGNDGEQGLDEVSSPSINSAAISVGSFEGSGYLSSYFQVEGVTNDRFDYSDQVPQNLTETELDLVVPLNDPEGCKPYEVSMNGSVALIRRGTCTFVAKAKLAQDAGAIGCIFYNNADGGLRPKVDDPSIHIFGHGISKAQGESILAQIKTSGSVKVTYKREKGVFKNEMANQISIFSSWGLGPELELKPDMAAPGGYIYSTIPVAKGSFSTMSGTSMATPYIAGAASLLLEYDPLMDRNEVLGRLQSSAKPGLYKDQQIPDTVARQGAGMVSIYDAIIGKATIQPTHLPLNDTEHMANSYTLTLKNEYPTSETFLVSHVPAMSILGYTSTGQPADKITYDTASAEMEAEEASIELQPGESRDITLRFKSPANLDEESHWIYSGYIRITPSKDTARPAIQVPYAGMHGSYGTVDMLDLDHGFPVILGPTPDGRMAPISNQSGQEQRSYSMTGSNIVTMLLKISNPMHNLQIFVADTKTKHIVGMVPVPEEFIGRTDAVRTKFFAVPWHGRVFTRDGSLVRVPNGEYALVVLAPKPFADLQGGAHETWVSPTIVIRR